ncbi:Neuronal PAS domain-containing protein 4 [Papilio machaon]|uniref:Neuronal PAS domain-containing protein 4 n=1 Tax=Papilio machaon TaxID=76193 RepID=A0A194RK54_PAPMA|nr:Neuronal PAS domain-containing protein 4 [Papilio machaon]
MNTSNIANIIHITTIVFVSIIIVNICWTFDQGKSTKGASKLRRDLINAEIANLRDLLPLPPSTRQRLSQLQLMALVCVYVRKSNYFQQDVTSTSVARLDQLAWCNTE